MSEAITNNFDLWSSALLTKSTAGRGSNGKLEAYGIKKLRELILELAVRGKLVPQDPKDKTASKLLNEIADEKKRLVKEGRIKAPKQLPEVNIEEMNCKLPQGWEWVRFGTIAQHNSGKTLDSGRNTGQLRDYITTSNLYWGRFDLANIRQMPITDDELEKCSASKGDLLICEGGEAGRAAVWPYDHEVCFQNHVHRARFYGEEIDPYFIYRFFEKLNATGEIDEHRKGVGISNMSSKALALIALTLPPYAEQHRIVAKVDELMALCDQLEQQQTHSIEAHQTLVETLLGTLTCVESQQELTEAWARITNHFDILFTTEHSIDQLKQTILQLAVMGKLVPHDPNDEPGSVLLEEIATEKARLVEEGKIKKEKQAADIAAVREPFDIPEGWIWSDLSQLLALVTDGDHQAPPQSEEGVPFLVIGNLNTGKINFDGCKYVPIEYYEKLDWVRKPIKGDLLYTVTGSFGIPVPVETREKFCVQRHVAILKATDSTPKRYLELVLGSVFSIDYATTIATGIAQKTVPLTGLRRMPVPVAPEKEQQRIVAKVEELMALCDAIKARLADAKATQIHLADAIVEQAVA